MMTEISITRRTASFTANGPPANVSECTLAVSISSPYGPGPGVLLHLRGHSFI
jgi:hypothetical protein